MFRWFLTNSKVIEHLLFSKQADWVLKSKKQNTQTKPLYFLYIHPLTVRQKLGMVLKNKALHKLKLSKIKITRNLLINYYSYLKKYQKEVFISFILMAQQLDWASMSVLKCASSPCSNTFTTYVKEILLKQKTR